LICSVSMSHKTTSWKSKTSICRWQAGRLSCRAGGKSHLWGRISLNLLRERLEHEEGVGQHDQGQMTMQAIPTASLILIQATFPLAVFIELLDWPAQMRQFHQASQGSVGRQTTEKPLGLTFLAWDGALPKQPAFRSSYVHGFHYDEHSPYPHEPGSPQIACARCLGCLRATRWSARLLLVGH
jgi:hypothetical protein